MARIARVALLAVLFVVAGKGAHAGPGNAPGDPPLFLQASLSAAGPYGQSWYLTLAPNGEVTLQVFYVQSPSGTLLARLSLSGQHVLAIRKACASQDFFGLAPELAPPQRAFHRPLLQIQLHLGGRHHGVSLYDPAALQGQATTRRFLAVWQSVFEPLPLRPSW